MLYKSIRKLTSLLSYENNKFLILNIYKMQRDSTLLAATQQRHIFHEASQTFASITRHDMI